MRQRLVKLPRTNTLVTAWSYKSMKANRSLFDYQKKSLSAVELALRQVRISRTVASEHNHKIISSSKCVSITKFYKFGSQYWRLLLRQCL